MRPKFSSNFFSICLLLIIALAGVAQFAQSQVFPSASVNEIRGFTIAAANSSSLVQDVTFTALNLNRSAIPGANFVVYFSDSSSGVGVTINAGTSQITHSGSGWGSISGVVSGVYTSGVYDAFANINGIFKIRIATTVSTKVLYPVAFSRTTGIRVAGTTMNGAWVWNQPGDEFFWAHPLNQVASALIPKRFFVERLK